MQQPLKAVIHLMASKLTESSATILLGIFVVVVTHYYVCVALKRTAF